MNGLTATEYAATRLPAPEPAAARGRAGLPSDLSEADRNNETAARLRMASLFQERARLAVAPGLAPETGDNVVLLPSHIDPAVSLNDGVFVCDGQGLERWPADRRRDTMLANPRDMPQ